MRLTTDPAFPANPDFSTVEYIREPVWRTERIDALPDLHLKNDTSKLEYLNPLIENSNDSQ